MTLASQLREAWRQSDVTLASLRERAELTCSADSLSRKLAEKQIMTTTEAERLAVVLDVRLVWAPDRRARRRAA